MRARTSLTFLGLIGLLSVACSDDGVAQTTQTTSASDNTSGGAGTADSAAGDDGGLTGGATGGASDAGGSTGAGTSGGDATGADGTTGMMCDPQVPGDWNSCIDEEGNVDNTLCEWMGLPGSDGFIGCLTSSQGGGNVCFISGCNDVCDCFAAPATGTAPVVCAPVLEDGGMGCALDCSNGETCPDGMECQGTLCFWPGSGTGSTGSTGSETGSTGSTG